MRKIYLAGFAGLAALAIACGAGDSDVSGGSGAPAGAGQASGEPAQQVVLTKKVGQTIDVSSDTNAIHYVITKTEQRTGEAFVEPAHGIYLAAYLQVNVTKGNTYACSCELSFLEPNGTVHESTFASISGRKAFEDADVAAGQKTAGWVFFDVPKKAIKGGKIQLKVTNLFTEDKYAYWTL